jgi:hypothetical protein
VVEKMASILQFLLFDDFCVDDAPFKDEYFAVVLSAGTVIVDETE